MFCKNCGSKLPKEVGFCAGCGAKLIAQTSALRARPFLTHTAMRKPLKNVRMEWLLLPIAVLLILLGIGYMALAVTGKPITAQVIDYEQVLFINNDDSTRNPSRYKLDYQFAINGERYTGSVTRIFQGGSHMRQTIMVRYLPFWPHVNAEDSGGASLAGPIMTGAGILLLVFEVKSKPRVKVDKLLYPK